MIYDDFFKYFTMVSMFVQRARGIVGTRRDRQGTARGPPGAGLQRLQSLQRRWGFSLFFIVHHCSFSYQPVIRCFEIYRFPSIFQFIKLPRKSNLDRSLELHPINHLHACDGRGSRATPRIVSQSLTEHFFPAGYHNL